MCNNTKNCLTYYAVGPTKLPDCPSLNQDAYLLTTSIKFNMLHDNSLLDMMERNLKKK